ncbi:MAG: hypothetical protein IPM03_08285 [Sulfuritalea sp.]|nr:hypothetical protein [Sulfuritalea sp.]
MIAAARGSPPDKENGALQGAVGGQSEQAQTAVAELCYPSPATVKGAVLADLLRGDNRASHHVLMLRRSGFPVVTDEIDVSTSDGRIARIARYSLPAEAIAAAGERGQRFAQECARVEAERRSS